MAEAERREPPSAASEPWSPTSLPAVRSNGDAGLGRRFSRSDLNNLLEVSEPARRHDVVLETDDIGEESCQPPNLTAVTYPASESSRCQNCCQALRLIRVDTSSSMQEQQRPQHLVVDPRGFEPLTF